MKYPTVRLTIDIEAEMLAVLRLHAVGISPSQVVRAALAEYIARHPEPVPATPAPQPPALIPRGAPTPARALHGKPSARWCAPRRVPGGREE